MRQVLVIVGSTYFFWLLSLLVMIGVGTATYDPDNQPGSVEVIARIVDIAFLAWLIIRCIGRSLRVWQAVIVLTASAVLYWNSLKVLYLIVEWSPPRTWEEVPKVLAIVFADPLKYSGMTALVAVALFLILKPVVEAYKRRVRSSKNRSHAV